MSNKEQSNINIARAYSTVFRGTPWKEAFKNASGQFFGDEYDKSWKELGLALAYPLLETSVYITKELARSDSVYITITSPQNPNRVVGFGWGFGYKSAEELVEEKWSGLKNQDKCELSDYLKTKLETQSFWYLSEVGVLPNLQSKGLGTQIVENLIRNAPARQPIIMRTNAYSPMTVIASKAGFEQIYGPRTQRVDGQITVQSDLVVGGIDSLNPNRVLYLLSEENRRNNE